MSEFSTEHFKLFSFNINNNEHYEFLQKMLKDELTQSFLKDFDLLLLAPEGNNPLDNSYLVALNDQIVGYLSLFDYTPALELHYGVAPSYRGIRNNSNETIGCQIVKETASFIFENYKKIEYLRLYIDEFNIKSIKMAQRAGFTLQDKYGYYEEYTKHRSK